MNGFIKTMQALGPGRMIALGLVAIGLMSFFLFVTERLTEPNFALLYANLPADEAGEIAGELDAMGVPFEIAGNGSQIMVPVDDVGRLRLALANQGLPSFGSAGYEMFDESESFGATSFMNNMNLLRATEAELARTITGIDAVRSARVHIVMPKRELFERDTQDPTASVFLDLRTAGNMAADQVAAIQSLVSAAVPRLKPNRVSVVDARGTLLAAIVDDPTDVGNIASRAETFRRATENTLRRKITELLERSVGIGRVRVEVSADINFDRVTINEETYDPDGQVVRSTQTIEDTANSTQPSSDSVSIANNLPESEAAEAGANRENSARTEETVNFEISRTIRNHIQETGTPERLSVAVLVDGTYTPDPAIEGNLVYQPRGEDNLAQLKTLVQSAIGFDADRGDVVEVVNMQFAAVEVPEPPVEPLFGLTKSDYFKIAEMIVISIVTILVIMLVLRPFVTRVLAGMLETRAVIAAAGAAEAAAAIAGPGGQPLLTGPEGASPGSVATPDGAAGTVSQGATGAAGGDGGGDKQPEEEEDSLIDLSRIEGKVKASSMRKVGEVVDKHPDEALAILRSWISEGAG